MQAEAIQADQARPGKQALDGDSAVRLTQERQQTILLGVSRRKADVPDFRSEWLMQPFPRHAKRNTQAGARPERDAGRARQR